MDDLQTRFETAAQDAQRLQKQSNNATRLRLYALYQQATVGDVQGERPDPDDRAEYDAWARLEGIDPDAAKEQYVALVRELKGAGPVW